MTRETEMNIRSEIEDLADRAWVWVKRHPFLVALAVWFMLSRRAKK